MGKESPMSDQATQNADETGLACNLFGREFAERKETISRDLLAHAEQVEELPDGFGYRFPAAEPWTAKVLDFIAAEKECCPFFTFELIFEPNDGPLWLRLRGSEAIKEFVLAELDGIAPKPGHDLAATMPIGEASVVGQNAERAL
jgi:hypothetical protein